MCMLVCVPCVCLECADIRRERQILWAGVVEGCELTFMLGIKSMASERAATSPLLNPSLFGIIFVFQILERFKVLG